MSAQNARGHFANVAFVDFRNRPLKSAAPAPQDSEAASVALLDHVGRVFDQLVALPEDQFTGAKFSLKPNNAFPVKSRAIQFAFPMQLSLGETFLNWARSRQIELLPRGDLSFTILGRGVARNEAIRRVDEKTGRGIKDGLEHHDITDIDPLDRHNRIAATHSILQWAMQCTEESPGMNDTLMRMLRHFDLGPNENGYAPEVLPRTLR